MVSLEVRRVFKFNGDSSTKAMVDVAIAGEFLVRGFRVINGRKGLFVSAPGEQGKDGKWYRKAYPLTKETQAELTKVVLEAYEGEGA
jgi:stage V sporulation protein G